MSGQSNPAGGSQAGLPFLELTSGWKQPESVNYELRQFRRGNLDDRPPNLDLPLQYEAATGRQIPYFNIQSWTNTVLKGCLLSLNGYQKEY